MNKQAKIALFVCLILMVVLVLSFVAAKPGTRAKKECNDGIDNDGDGDIDLADAGCDNRQDNDESNCGDSVCEGVEVCDICIADCGHCDSCSDTDGGNFPLIFGTTSGYYNNIPYSNDDYCVDTSNILEYYCSGDYEQSQQQSCGTDSYGSNYCSGGDVYRDFTDYSCSAGTCNSTVTPELVEECTYGCTAGECNPIPDSCSDTDGGYVIETQGTVSGYLNESQYEDTDYCLGNTTLREYFCVGDYAYNSDVGCAGNTTSVCSNGACI
jgi:hypothetical protein